MTFTLLPHLLPFLVGFAVLTGAALLLAVVGLVTSTPAVVRARRTRLGRHETVLHYYGHLALGH